MGQRKEGCNPARPPAPAPLLRPPTPGFAPCVAVEAALPLRYRASPAPRLASPPHPPASTSYVAAGKPLLRSSASIPSPQAMEPKKTLFKGVIEDFGEEQLATNKTGTTGSVLGSGYWHLLCTSSLRLHCLSSPLGSNLVKIQMVR
ncbi:hypothetical protein ZWY2020_058520 [Hordeum vulgare]|nr:hypothetical protein ZWY2020_058520 [Hordeum vulgare]